MTNKELEKRIEELKDTVESLQIQINRNSLRRFGDDHYYVPADNPSIPGFNSNHLLIPTVWEKGNK